MCAKHEIMYGRPFSDCKDCKEKQKELEQKRNNETNRNN